MACRREEQWHKEVIPFLLIFLIALVLGACRPPDMIPPPAPPEIPPAKVEPLEQVSWMDIDGWLDEELEASLDVFLKSCGQALRHRPLWQRVCAEAALVDPADQVAVQIFFETAFVPYRLRQPDGSDTGLMTGYYVPDLQGSRTRSERFRYPLYGVPDDLLVIDLRAVYPELGNYRLRGRLEGRRVVPYYGRAEIEAGKASLDGKELFWVEDPVELFFLQIQGSGRITLETGERIMVNYAEQNGHPYRSIGNSLIARGEMTIHQMSMQNIKAWAQMNPTLVAKLLDENPSYVFFRELTPDFQSPPGALGIPLTPGRSLAVDPRTVPLGAPVFVSTTWPNSSAPLKRLMLAQDTGGAIKGPVRADFFWGLGDQAGELAGRMKQPVRLWVLLPRESASPEISAAKK
jgi:membrane-bound lytic murein transglycosylase A